MIALLATVAAAYETDQLVDRDQPLDDIRLAANAEADRRLDAAVAATNTRLRCSAAPERTLRVLAAEVHARTGAPGVVPDRGPLRSRGFTQYSAWMESDPALDRVSFGAPRTDVFSDVTWTESLILNAAGTNSTFRVAGVRMGSDKAEHFWDLGYAYLRASDWGAAPERGIRHGVLTEYGIYGLQTSRTFSWADLAANWAGYRWYARLLTDGSELQLGDDGCVHRVAGFDWAAWVGWEWDEVLNPSHYAPPVEAAIHRYLVANRAEVCSSFGAWREPDYEATVLAALTSEPAWASGAPETRWDPFRLGVLCSEDG